MIKEEGIVFNNKTSSEENKEEDIDNKFGNEKIYIF